MKELWRIRHVADAYTDQTGLAQRGTVVYEQIAVEETGERFDVDDGYAKHPGLGRVVREVAVEGKTTIPEGREPREFGLWPETVDYSGGMHIRLRFDPPTRADGSPDKTYGYWRPAPSKHRGVKGFAYPDGAAPVVRLLPEE